MDPPAPATPALHSTASGGRGGGLLWAGNASFRSLKPLDVKPKDSGDDPMDAPIPIDQGLRKGVLANGVTYYVRRNAKPQARAALALVVNVGSLVEEEKERGVAHIVEHLAFSATKKYSNHDIVKFLESIGAEFGACQNAYTSSDETVFELMVPVDKPELLSTAISVLAEFASEIRASDEDINKERGAVLEEWRERRNAKGRMMEAHWKLLLEGSKYAERLPIGLESVIRSVDSETVRGFYEKWYRPNNMAVIAVGDFADSDEAVVALIKEHFEAIQGPCQGPKSADSARAESASAESASNGPGKAPPVARLAVPEEPFIAHSEPRIAAVVEKESEGSAVIISCKLPVTKMVTLADYRSFLVDQMFHQALNQRLFNVAHAPPPPFYSCQSVSEPVTRSTRAFSLSATCQTKGTLAALEAVCTELERVKLHGFSEREIARVRMQYLSEMESAYVEKDQNYSDNFRAEYTEHFLRGEPAPGIEYEARLAKTLLPDITAAEVSALGKVYELEQNCVVKILEPQAHATVDAMKDVLARVARSAAAGDIPAWQEENLPDSILEREPEPGTVVKERTYEPIGATELVLSNGMRVCYKCTDFLDDQVLLSGYSYGGLSEVSEAEYYSCALSQSIAEEVGVFGHKPAVMLEMLAGKRVDLSAKIGTYMRAFSGEASPGDLETALQLVYQLFVTAPRASEESMQLILQMTREAISAQLRDPYSAFTSRVNELNYGQSRYFRAVNLKDLASVDPARACEYFNDSFRDPSTFTVAVVGKMKPDTLLPLIKKYLGGIPAPEAPLKFQMKFKREALTPIPVKFPKRAIREEVRRRMEEEQSTTQVTFPVKIPAGPEGVEEVARLGFLCKLLETRIMRTLRFQHGHIYTAAVSPYFGHSRPTREEKFLGDVAISFSSDPWSVDTVVSLALEQVKAMQESGPAAADLTSVIEIEQRAYETGQHENGFWLERIIRGYQSRLYSGDLYSSYRAQEEVRKRVIAELSPASMTSAFRTILPMPCTAKYTAVSLLPLPPLWRRLLSLPPKPRPGLTFESKIALAVAGAAVVAALLCRTSFGGRRGESR